MKKIKYLVVLLLSLVLITGCSIDFDKDISTKSDKETETKVEKPKKDKDDKKETSDKTDKNDKNDKNDNKKKPTTPSSNVDSDAALVCNLDQIDDTMDMLGTVLFYYNDEDILSNINFIFDITLKDESVKQMWPTFVELLDEQFNQQYPVDGQAGLELISTYDDANYTYNLKINIDLSQADLDTVNEILGFDFDGVNLKVPVNELRTAFIEEGFTCQ